MRAADFRALDQWAAKQAAERGETVSDALFIVAYDEPRLLGIRTHRWVVGNVVFVNGIDFQYFHSKLIAAWFARLKTFEGKPAKAVPR